MKLLLAGFLAAAALALGSTSRARAEDATAPPAVPPAARTVILVRHAEKEATPQDPRDPSLSESGTARADELARLLGASGAAYVFTSDLKRTQETVAPLAARLGVSSEALPAANSEGVVARLDALPAGSVAVVCGHSNTVPRVAELLGIELTDLVDVRGTKMIDDDTYDRAFVITRPAGGPAACLELNYGAALAKTSSAGK